MQVDAFTGGIGRDQYLNVWRVAELFLNLAPVITVGAAMDGQNGFGTAQHAANALHQIVEGVFVFGKDNQFAPVACAVIHLWPVLQQAGQLFPLLILARLHYLQSLMLKTLQGGNLCFQFRDTCCCGGLIDYLFAQKLVFFGT